MDKIWLKRGKVAAKRAKKVTIPTRRTIAHEYLTNKFLFLFLLLWKVVSDIHFLATSPIHFPVVPNRILEQSTEIEIDLKGLKRDSWRGIKWRAGGTGGRHEGIQLEWGKRCIFGCWYIRRRNGRGRGKVCLQSTVVNSYGRRQREFYGSKTVTRSITYN